MDRKLGEGSPIESDKRTIELKPGQHVEDVYFLLPRERDTIIAALRVWQEINTESGRRFYGNNFNYFIAYLHAVAGKSEALDANEIDILIADKINK